MIYSACVTSALRLYYSVVVQRTGDVTYNIAPLGIASIAEASIGIMCCCFPVFPRYFQQVLSPKLQYLAKTTQWLRSHTRTRTRTREKSSSGWNEVTPPHVPSEKESKSGGQKIARLSGNVVTSKRYSTLMDDDVELQGLKWERGNSAAV